MRHGWSCWTLTLALVGVVGCSDNGGQSDGPTPTPDAKVGDHGAPPEARPEAALPDGPLADTLATTTEQEPNNGASATDYNTVQVPASITGAIGTPGDLDLFGVAAQAGDRFAVTLTSDGTLQPHLTIFDPAGKLPTAMNPGPGGTLLAEYYVLQSAALIIGVRDARNVGSGSQNVGGPAFGYTLSLLPLTRAPMNITVGGQQSASLAPAGTVRVFAFSAGEHDELVLQVLAKQLAPPSDVDSRLSLFYPAQKAWLGTNDDRTPGAGDSLLQGKMPFAGTYHAIVENEASTIGANLSFTLKLDKK